MPRVLLVTLLLCGLPAAARAQAPPAVAELEGRVAADPEDPGAAYDLALAYHAAYDLPRSIEQYRRAQTLDPTNSLIHTSLQTALTEWALLRESMAQFRTTFGQARQNAAAAFNLALAAERHGLIEEAIFHYRQYLAQAPNAHDWGDVGLRVAALEQAIQQRRVRILKLGVKPPVVRPGARAAVIFAYEIRGWGRHNRTGVIERVSLYRDEEETHRFIQRSIRDDNKKYKAHMEILIPTDAAPGTYSLVAAVVAGSRRDDQLAVFAIAPPELILPEPIVESAPPPEALE